MQQDYFNFFNESLHKAILGKRLKTVDVVYRLNGWGFGPTTSLKAGLVISLLD